jgi:aminoglycoside phosphotransferase (APT) family kinase protein
MPVDAESAELAASLLATAGLGSQSAIEHIGDHWSDDSNALYSVTDDLGGRYVLRRFTQKPPPQTALARLRRECWAYDVLATVGVPVPRVLATSEEAGAEASLTTNVEGEHLGTVVSALAPAEAAVAWSSCGTALAAVHAVDAGRAAAAGCDAVGIEPTVARGGFHHDQALEHLERLSASRPELGSFDELRAAVSDALPLYERAPLALCQYDAHLWQLLVARTRGEWTCSAILDWEHADLDDPDWDLAMLDGFRFDEVGVVPPAFFAGYGRTPTSPLYVLYRLERAAWILAGYTGGARWLEQSIPLSEHFVSVLLATSSELRARIGAA